ncbi:hypothetical protein [Nocardioides sp. W7]|uniref:hypothetical protein n=1 Tax=Nocardioides sp. W7 TaxID=2931390 RepID=UPI001FD61A32|nr:hypothetical protein [Nocardioides sp. W7]
MAAAAAIPGATEERRISVAGRIAVSTTSGLHIRRIERAVVRKRLPGAPPSGAASIARAVRWGADAAGAVGVSAARVAVATAAADGEPAAPDAPEMLGCAARAD